jgi:DNA-binding response OmpR family regulator
MQGQICQSPDDAKPKGPFIHDKFDGTSGSRKKLSILVVDDEALIAETLADILNDVGFDARIAMSAEEAMRLAKAAPPDILLTDVLMPRVTGVELGIWMRKELPGTRVVLISGQSSTAELLRKAENDGNSFELLPKPIHPEELIARLRIPRA